jgi:hypothetical protein
MTDTGLVPVSAAAVMGYGYPSVSAMLADSPFFVAYHGGSGSWPACSLHAYTQAVFAGAGALEVRLARTADGVWFGLPGRTVRDPDGLEVDPASLLWSDLRRYRIPAPHGSGSAPQPYMRVEELVDVYGSTHVLFVDPYDTSVGGILLEYLSTLMGKERIVASHPADGVAFARAAKSRGIASYGYFADPVVPSIKEHGGHWDFLGLPFGAPQEAWDTASGFGKPVAGFGAASPGEADEAFQRGAAGLVGVKVVRGTAAPWPGRRAPPRRGAGSRRRR